METKDKYQEWSRPRNKSRRCYNKKNSEVKDWLKLWTQITDTWHNGVIVYTRESKGNNLVW